MIEVDAELNFAKAKDMGAMFMLICFDTYDRLKQDRDLGYYYPKLYSENEVLKYVSRMQTGQWNPTDSTDFCEAIIDLRVSGENFNAAACIDPTTWINAHCGQDST